MPIWSLSHLPTDGKEPVAFAVSWRTVKAAVSHLTDTNTTHFVVRFFAVRGRRQRRLCRQPPKADGKVGLCRSLLCRSLLPSADDGKGLCRPPFMPLPSAVADGKVADS